MRSPRPCLMQLTSAAALITVGLTAPAEPLVGQYFGRNLVQYESFDFQVLKTPHFDIYFYPEEEIATRDAARMAERWYERFSRIFDHQFTERQPIVFYGSHPAFQQSTFLGGVGEGTGGVTESAKQRVAMPLTGSYQETDHVLGHELVHAFQYDISGLGRNRGTVTTAARAFATAPLWFTEGMAEYLSEGPVDAHTAMIIREAALTGEIPSIEQMTRDPRIFPYTWGQAFWAYVGGRWGDAVVGQILKQVGQGVPYEEAFERILNTSLEEIGEDWASAIRRAYLPLLNERTEAREVARPLITQQGEGGRYNVGPSVSPDGRFVAFLSELDILDVELYLADAETGEVIRRLQRGSALDPHFQSLRFLNSAGTWSPDSRQFAFAALRGGRDRLVILDVQRADIVREVSVPNVSEIISPTWSPDGSTIVFSGIEGGVSDLYAYDVASGVTRQLTDDLFANLHPSFSPDGSQIAFATDQGAGTDLATLRYGGYQIALLDMASGTSRLLPGMERGININPTWTADGSGIFFVSDRGGSPNIYRLALESGDRFQITRLFSGVAGITDISPAISSARAANRLIFTVYERNGYNLYSLTTPEELAGTPVAPGELAEGVALPSLLPPLPRPPEPAFNRVAAMLAEAEVGLPEAGATQAWPVSSYRPRLSLDYLGQPQVGVSTGNGYNRGGVYGGVAAVFSDVLGYHTIFAAVQAQGQVEEIGFSTVYLYRKHRWNYGAAAQRIPYAYGQYGRGIDPSDGLLKEQVVRTRFFDTSLQGIAQYPFSQVQRLELSGGVRRLANDFEIFERVFDPSGFPISEDIRNVDGESLNLVETSAALVYDNSLTGYTSPFAGQRYRFELSPTFGEISYIQALADYRRYLFLRPFTAAFRGLHFGRYGAEAEGTGTRQPFFNDLYLGQPSLIRGYADVFSSCRQRPTDEFGRDNTDCNLLSSLLGSRIGVVNAELRFPLIRQLVVGSGIGLPPVEGFAFFDAGVAWRQGVGVAFERGILNDPGRRGILTSAGVGARINLLGYLILEVDYVRAFERERGWQWQFAVQPGF